MKFTKGWRLAGLVVLVLLVHAGLLATLKAQWQPTAVLTPMAEPLFLHTIALKPQAARRAAPSARRQNVAAPARGNPPPASAEPSSSEPVALSPEDQTATPPGSVAPPVDQGSPNGAAAPDTPALPKVADAKPEEGPTADPWPADTRVSYRMRGFYRGDLYGSAKVQWQRQQQRYQVHLDIRMALLFQVSMTSQGQLTETGLVPQAYEERFLSMRRSVSFDADQLRLQDGRMVTKPAGVQDTASQFVALSHRFSSGLQPLAIGEVVSIWLARPGGLDFWTYDVTESVNLQTPELGLVQAFHLKPRPLANPRGDIVAELWLAPSLQYLPVRVRIALGGENYVDLVVETIEQGAAPPAPQANVNNRSRP